MSRWTIFLSCRYPTAGKWKQSLNRELYYCICKKVTNLPKSVQQSRLHPSQSSPEWRKSLKSSISFKIRFSLYLYSPLFSRTAHPQTSVQTPKQESSSGLFRFWYKKTADWTKILISDHLHYRVLILKHCIQCQESRMLQLLGNTLKKLGLCQKLTFNKKLGLCQKLSFNKKLGLCHKFSLCQKLSS